MEIHLQRESNLEEAAGRGTQSLDTSSYYALKYSC